MRLVLTAMLLVLGLPQAEAASIAPHRAVYDLTLARSNQGADLSSAEGRLAFEVQGSACEGWTVSFRMANRFAPVEGDVRTVDMQSTSFESGDFLDLRYNSKEYVNGKLEADNRLKASRKALGEAGQLQREGREGAPTALPAAAMFPTQHQLHLMDIAAKGATRDDSLIYDGSEEEKVYRVISFIGKRKGPGENRRDVADPAAKPLSALPSWPVSISYYDAEGGGDTPSYQISFDLYENGVATGLLLDYGNFALTGSLKSLEPLGSPAGCN